MRQKMTLTEIKTKISFVAKRIDNTYSVWAQCGSRQGLIAIVKPSCFCDDTHDGVELSNSGFCPIIIADPKKVDFIVKKAFEKFRENSISIFCLLPGQEVSI